MGSFSWTRADKETKRSNFTGGDRYRILVPLEFGGGYIEDTYIDYGWINECENAIYVDAEGNEYSNFPKNDLYGVLAWWNNAEGMEYIGSKPLTMIDILNNGETCVQNNRLKGIEIGCLDDDIDSSRFPLKMVSLSCRDTYESCTGKSYSDPNQGFFKGYWTDKDYAKYIDKF